MTEYEVELGDMEKTKIFKGYYKGI